MGGVRWEGWGLGQWRERVRVWVMRVGGVRSAAGVGLVGTRVGELAMGDTGLSPRAAVRVGRGLMGVQGCVGRGRVGCQ